LTIYPDTEKRYKVGYILPSTAKDLRVLIVADDPLARAGLAALLAGQTGCTVVGQVTEDTDLLATLDVHRPDVIVWDLGWEPTLSTSTSPTTRLERLSDVEDAMPPIVALLPDETHATEARIAGARGILLRDIDAEHLVAALIAAAQELVVLDPSLVPTLLATGDPSPPQMVEELTPRELEVLQLLAEGLPNKTIAHQLGISEHTVKFHVNAIMGKLGAQSRTEAVVRATRLGLILL
jgi:two-component system nitrate/nitrite response regulator NarL